MEILIYICLIILLIISLIYYLKRLKVVKFDNGLYGIRTFSIEKFSFIYFTGYRYHYFEFSYRYWKKYRYIYSDYNRPTPWSGIYIYVNDEYGLGMVDKNEAYKNLKMLKKFKYKQLCNIL